jgi:hypothetical protein
MRGPARVEVVDRGARHPEREHKGKAEQGPRPTGSRRTNAIGHQAWSHRRVQARLRVPRAPYVGRDL